MKRALLVAASLLALAPYALADVRGSSCTTTDGYIPGATATMCWTCTSGGPASPSPECLDSVALGYPDGWTVACDTQDPADSAGSPVAFACAAAGQTVTYSDTDDGPGEVCPGRTWSFCVDVAAPASVSEPVCAFYTISGDGSGGAPHDIIDCGSCLPAPGTVTIATETVPVDAGGQLFGYSGDLGAFSQTGGQSRTVDDLAPGSYAVAQAVAAGWDLTGLSCADPDGGTTVDPAAGAVTLDVDPGEHVVCTFVNTARGSVTIATETVPADAGGQLFGYAGDLGAFSQTGGQSRTFADLAPGAYAVAEAVPAGWDLTGLSCADPDGGTTVDPAASAAALDVDPGEHVVCTFVNTARGSVTIVKETAPAGSGGQLFDFAGTLGSFSLAGGESHTVGDLAPGARTVTEAVPAGWDLTAITCVDPDGGSSGDPATATATLDVDPGEHVVCTFLNTVRGSVTIATETVPADAGGQLFDYAGDLGAFSQTGGESRTVEDLAPGVYAVSEALPPGWDLTGLSCADPDGGTTVDPAAATATLDLDPGEHVVCTFVNTARGSVTIATETVPVDAGGQLFGYAGDLGAFSQTGGQSRTVDDLAPGAYAVTEVVPPGWDLTGLSCADPDGGTTVDPAAATATLDLDPGEHVVCTFVNTARGSVTIATETVPVDAGGQLFGYAGDLGAFSQTGGDSRTVDDLAPGSYAVAQAVAAGWELTGLTCVDPDGGSTVDPAAGAVTLDLDPGEHVVCTFVNTAVQASVTIFKETLPRNSGSSFGFTGDLGPFSLSGGESVTFGGLDPGAFTVAETPPPAGWTLVTISCDDPDGGTAVDLAGAMATLDVDTGEHITCFFLNRSDDYDPAPIPTLSTSGLLLLVVLLAAAGLLLIRGRIPG